MALILELEPETERQLEANALRAGVSKETWARDFLQKGLAPAVERLSEAEIARRLKLMDESVEAARDYSKGTEPLSDYAISREAIYTPYEWERNE